MQDRIYSIVLQLSIIISLALAFGALGFLYSFTGFFDHQRKTIPVSLDPFEYLTIEEIGGHFLFGFIVGIPFRNLKISMLIGSMALTIDMDHFLNYAGFHIQDRIAHSIPFIILSSIIMSVIVTKICYKITNANQATLLSFSSRLQAAIISNKHNNTEKKNKTRSSINIALIEGNRLSLLFLVITITAFLSHIAYDVFIDNNARFPLFAPFSYSQFVIPRTCGLPIEAAGLVLAYVIYRLYCRNLS